VLYTTQLYSWIVYSHLLTSRCLISDFNGRSSPSRSRKCPSLSYCNSQVTNPTTGGRYLATDFRAIIYKTVRKLALSEPSSFLLSSRYLRILHSSSLYELPRWISSLTVDVWRSLRITVLCTYQGASTIMLSIQCSPQCTLKRPSSEPHSPTRQQQTIATALCK
jgi:hypothetical protein